jgi:hypothetical protein
VDEGRQTVMHPVSACWAQVGDSVWYTYSDLAGRLLAVTWQIHVSPLRLSHVSDSVRRALSQRYGEGRRCEPASFGRYILDYHRWTSEGLSIQMLSNSFELPGTYPVVAIQVQRIAPVCGQWLDQPYPSH